MKDARSQAGEDESADDFKEESQESEEVSTEESEGSSGDSATHSIILEFSAGSKAVAESRLFSFVFHDNGFVKVDVLQAENERRNFHSRIL